MDKKALLIVVVLLIAVGVVPPAPAATLPEFRQTICRDLYTSISPVAAVQPLDMYVVEKPADCPQEGPLSPWRGEIAILNYIDRIPMINVATAQATDSKDITAPQTASPGRPSLSVGFEFDKYSLSVNARKNLDRFSAELDKNIPVSIDGYTCWIGDPSYNLALSEKRALSVEHYLKHTGVKINRVRGKGATEFKTRSKAAPNRRVDIAIEKGGE